MTARKDPSKKSRIGLTMMLLIVSVIAAGVSWAYGTYARAGFDRNVKMADYSTHVVVFWDGSSPGTKHMRGHATLRALPLVTILVDLTKEKQE